MPPANPWTKTRSGVPRPRPYRRKSPLFVYLMRSRSVTSGLSGSSNRKLRRVPSDRIDHEEGRPSRPLPCPHGRQPSRPGEMSFSFLLRALRGRQVSNPKGVEPMSQQSFCELGVSPALCQGARRSLDRAALQIQALRLPDALAGSTSSLEVADRIRQDPGRSRSRSSSARRRRPTAERARPRPHPRAGQQVTEDIAPLAAAQDPPGRRGLRRPPGLQAQAARADRPRPCGHSRAAAGSGRAPDGRPLGDPDPRPGRGRSHARHGLPPAGGPHRAPPARNRQTMFFSATLDGEAGELARAYTRSHRPTVEADLPTRRSPGRPSTVSSP